MNHIGVRQIIIIYLVIILLIVFNALIPNLFIYRYPDSVGLSPERFSDGEDDLSYRLKNKQDPKVMTFSATVDKDELAGFKGEDLGLSLTKLEAQGYTVRWNGQCIGYAGDPVEGKANIWNSSFWFVIPKEIIQDVNTLEIEMYSDYEVGAYKHSIIISDLDETERISANHMMYSTGLSLAGIGMAVFSLIITFGLTGGY